MAIQLLRGLLSACLSCFAILSLPALAWDMAGTKTIKLYDRDGQATPVGTVNFDPQGDKTAFSVKMNPVVLKDFFLSMKEFKCLEGTGEILCHAPYPYAKPATVTRTDLAWLEHSLLFFFKLPKDFGAKWWNGIYFRLQLTDQGLVGTPEAIDLNLISAPLADGSRPPYGAAQRSEIPSGTRWFSRLTIE